MGGLRCVGNAELLTHYQLHTRLSWSHSRAPAGVGVSLEKDPHGCAQAWSRGDQQGTKHQVWGVEHPCGADTGNKGMQWTGRLGSDVKSLARGLEPNPVGTKELPWLCVGQ